MTSANVHGMSHGEMKGKVKEDNLSQYGQKFNAT